MTSEQGVVFIFGIIFVGVSIYFHRRNSVKLPGVIMFFAMMLIVVAAIDPASIEKLLITKEFRREPPRVAAGHSFNRLGGIQFSGHPPPCPRRSAGPACTARARGVRSPRPLCSVQRAARGPPFSLAGRSGRTGQGDRRDTCRPRLCSVLICPLADERCRLSVSRLRAVGRSGRAGGTLEYGAGEGITAPGT